MMNASVDVIIPTYRPNASFRDLLRMLMRQSCPVDHILIINTDESLWDERLISGIGKAEVFHITKKEFDHAATRNMGVGFSNADYLLFMTQDAMPADRGLVSALLGTFGNPAVKAAYARQLPKADSPITEGCVRNFNYPDVSEVRTLRDLPELGIKTYFCSNVCAMYERETFIRMGGFSAPAIFNEDMVYAARIMHLGYGVAYCAEARVYHAHHYTNAQQLHRNFDNGVSQAMHPEIFRGVGSSGEGKRLVSYVTRYLKEVGRAHLIPGFYRECAARLIGFRLGKAYRYLPGPVVRKLSNDPGFFDKYGYAAGKQRKRR